MIEQLKIELPRLNEGLLQEQSIKERDTLIKSLPIRIEHPLTDLEPLKVFEHLEEEYNKVKEFSFGRIETKDIERFVKRM